MTLLHFALYLASSMQQAEPVGAAATPAIDELADLVAAAEPSTWPGFRGVGTGHTRARELPLEWSDDEGRVWSVALEGFGQSSPVVWHDRVFVTSVDGPRKERLIVTALRLSDGERLWQRALESTLPVETSDMISRGAPTPAVDAERVYAFFESGDFVALDHDGHVLWRRALATEYGEFGGNHGIASSVVRGPQGLFLLVDHDGPSYLLRLDPATGENRWRVERDPRVSWTTPVLAAGEQLVVSSNGRVEGVDCATGSTVWRLDELRGNTTASPTVVGDCVIVGSSEGDANVRVRPAEADGDVEVLWQPSKARPSGFGSPLVADGRVFIVSKSGTLSAFRYADGELLWERRLPESTWASPITDGTHLWFFGKEGTTVVLRATDDGPDVRAENTLSVDGTVYGSAAVDRTILLRSGRTLTALRAP